jgi:hypothetical protein
MPASAAAVGVLIVAVTTGGVAVPSVGALQQRGLDALTARAGAASVPRILMLGDSQLLTYAFYTGMTYLHSTNPRYEFDPIIGCGVVGGGVQAERACDHRAAMWQRDVTELDPDLSVLMIGAWETLDFDVAGHTNVHATPEHERALASVLSSAIRPLLARGGHVALLEVPCYGHSTDDLPNHDQRTAPAAVSNVNDALRQVARRSPSSVTFVPWADAICPGGHFSPDVHGTRVRPDGVHYASAAASQLVSDAIMPTLQRLAVATHAQRAMARH